MSTYTPATFPRRPKNPTFLSEVRYHIQLAYYRYEVNTPLYVMSEPEKFAFNAILLLLLTMLFSATYYYFFASAALSVDRSLFYLTGRLYSSDAAKTIVESALTDSTRDAAASLEVAVSGLASSLQNGSDGVKMFAV